MIVVKILLFPNYLCTLAQQMINLSLFGKSPEAPIVGN